MFVGIANSMSELLISVTSENATYLGGVKCADNKLLGVFGKLLIIIKVLVILVVCNVV